MADGGDPLNIREERLDGLPEGFDGDARASVAVDGLDGLAWPGEGSE
jgi:hypothetical protein